MFLRERRGAEGRIRRSEVAGGRSAGRAERRFMGVVQEDVEEVGVGEEDAAEQQGYTEADDWLVAPLKGRRRRLLCCCFSLLLLYLPGKTSY